MKPYDFTQLFQDGSVDILTVLRDADKLPNLMQLSDSDCGWYPHETAIKFGQLETLKWLVNDSGQSIELFRRGTRSLACAAAYNRIDCLAWMLNESGQSPDIDPTGSKWFEADVYPEAARVLLRGASHA